jgi:putative ABC transport system ATP-binding protein
METTARKDGHPGRPAELPVETDAAVRVKGLNHYFGEGDSRNQVIFNGAIEIPRGQLVIVTGPSGSGKTTFLTLIGALRSIQEGSIELLGQELQSLGKAELAAARRNIGFIFQLHNLFDSLTAYENVQMAMQLADCPPEQMRARGTTILKRLGLGHRVDYKPDALSGGQRQRVAIARALVNRPKIILADEPTAALDKESSRDVVELLKEMASIDKSTILMVTHDNRILEAADRIVNIVDGRIASDVVIKEAIETCEFLRMSDVFKNLNPSELTNVSEKMTKRRHPAGVEIVRQGDEGQEFFLIGSGEVDVRVRKDGRAQSVATLSAGQFFGEAALISGEPRNATVVSKEEVLLYVLGREDFRKALETSATFKDQLLNVYFSRQ